MSTKPLPTIFSICSANLSFQDRVFEQLKADSKSDSIFLRRPEFNFPGNKFICFAEGYHQTLETLNAAQFSRSPLSIANGFMSEFFVRVSRLDSEEPEMPVTSNFFLFKKMVLSQVRIFHMFLRVKAGEDFRRTSILELSGHRDNRHTNEQWRCLDTTDPKEASKRILKYMSDEALVD
ncbi:hypothetical protein H7X65_00445 [Candidatus Parcubacteria bacterium]|nr:hypothetical protein [Candidatus Parcubacteria bacterium]